MTLGRLDYDTWYEVLALLSHDLAFSDKKKVRECRATLLHVALASRTLSDIALPALWQSMDSLDPIVYVINSSSSAEEGAFLYYQTYIRKSRWVSDIPADYEWDLILVTDITRGIQLQRRSLPRAGISAENTDLPC